MKSVLSVLTRSLVGGEKRHGARLLALLCLLFFLFPFQAVAQEGTILGTVTDPTGAAVPNAAISITNTDTGHVWRITTNAVGDYVAPDLAIGHYVVRAEATGFKVGEEKDIALAVADRRRVDFKLELGTAQQHITVEANPVAVQTDTGELSGLINSQQITDLAVDGRSFYNLLWLMPGTSNLMSDFQIPSSAPGGVQATVSVNGQRYAHNIYFLDGGEADDRGGAGWMSVMPSQDAIGEFKTLTSNYSADYGLSSAGTITMAIKSGTSQFHATAWEFDRNDDFNARYAFLLTKPELRFNVWGFNVGGPVALHESGTHKTFFFYNMEWRRLIQGATLNQNVPVPSLYGGVFPASLTAAQLHTPCSNQVDSTIAAQYTAAGQTLSTAGTGGVCTAAAGATLVPFTNNTIPTALLDPNAQLLLNTSKIFPTTNLVSIGNPLIEQYRGGGAAPQAYKEEIVRIDHQFSDKFSVFGHLVDDQQGERTVTDQWGGDNIPTIGSSIKNPAYSAVVHTVYSISPTLINEAAWVYFSNGFDILPAGAYAAPTGYTFGRVFTGPNADNRAPTINLYGATGTQYGSNWQPWINSAYSHQFRDDVSWVKGPHQLKFGGSWQVYGKSQDAFADTQGGFTFNGFYTGSDMADFLLGDAVGYSEDGTQNYPLYKCQSYALYIQDNWRATKRLTLNLGLRWDGVPHTYEAHKNFSDFYPNLYNPAYAATFTASGNVDPTGPAAGALGTSPNSILAGYQFYLNGVRIAGQPGVPHGMVHPTWDAFGPRIGFAYDITGSGKTVIRGGFGTMFERVQGNDVYDDTTNVPMSVSVGLNNVSLENAKLNIQTGSVYTSAQAPVPVASITGLSLDYPLPVSYQYSLGVERQIGAKAVLSVAYVGNQNRHQSYFQQVNIPPQSDLAALVANPGLFNSLVPYLGFHTIFLATDAENAHYNGLQVFLHGQLTKDLALQLAYTYSKAIDPGNLAQNSGDLSGDSNPYSWRYDLGPSPFDRRDVFVGNFIYQIPLLKHSPDRALRTGLGGWEVSGIVTAETGSPMNITLGGTQGSNGLPTGQNGIINRPDLTGSISYPKSEGEWFSTSAFSTPAVGAWGTAGYDCVYGPGRDNWNLSLFKSFSLSETRGSRLEFRFETFNTFNHVQWNSVDHGFTSGTFGRVTGAYDPRTLQLGLKLYF